MEAIQWVMTNVPEMTISKLAIVCELSTDQAGSLTYLIVFLLLINKIIRENFCSPLLDRVILKSPHLTKERCRMPSDLGL